MNKFFFLVIVLSIISGCTSEEIAFKSTWSDSDVDRNWAGEDYWLNPLQAWRQKEGRLHCEVSGGDRNAVLLTRELSAEMEAFNMSVEFRNEADANGKSQVFASGLSPSGWVGFQLGLKGQFNDFRDDALKGIGLCAGITIDGKLFIGDLSDGENLTTQQGKDTQLKLEATPAASSTYSVVLSATDSEGNPLGIIEKTIHASWLTGLMAITCSQSVPDTIAYSSPRPAYTDLRGLNKSIGGDMQFSFSSWKISGKKVTFHDDRRFGPILWTQHTLSDGVMKMSVQMAPTGNDNKVLVLSIDGAELSTEDIDPVSRSAIFKIVNWDSNNEHSYSIGYTSNNGLTYTYDGSIRKNPFQQVLKVASLSCVDDRGFPHQDLVENVTHHNPDLYVFHGDQLYERVGGYGVERNSILDYLRKWYIFGWSFKEALRNTPAVIIPDDHDVFHGNLWGEGGKKANVSLGYGYDSQDDGGYKEPPQFVNMVHKTQTGHLPDPFDKSPVLQGISVYYTNMNYGGVSFAILSDRQWKSAPKRYLPEAEIENGWPQNRSWNAKTEAFHPGTELLGPRQEQFLEKWAAKWDTGIAMKAVISQSPFVNVATLPSDMYHDKYVPDLPKYKKGEYPPDDRPVADFDSNGWPQHKRNRALSIMKKASAIHLTGDQHLGSTGQYGIEDYEDGPYWVATPAVSNLWPRRWFPAQEATSGKRQGDNRRYTGNYEDGFGNKMTVKAIANPYDIEKEPAMVYDNAPGYSIIDFNRMEHTIQIAVWPRWASPMRQAPDYKPFEGWPIVIDQLDNLGKGFKYKLEPVEVDGATLVKLYKNSSTELIYTIRPKAGILYAPVEDKEEYYMMTYSKDGSRRLISNMIAQ